jgi:ketosteroid isomerase-like protein
VNHDEARTFDELWAQRSCERLVHRYFALIDGGAAGSAIELFSADGVIEAAGNRREGREAVGAALRARESRTDRATRHVVTNLEVEVTGSTATASGTLLLFVTNGPEATTPDAVSALEMHFVDADGWAISLHRSTRLAERQPRQVGP